MHIYTYTESMNLLPLCKLRGVLTHIVFLRRKCKLTTTGPWQEIPPLALSDVTILPCTAQSNVDEVPLWAISNKGDVLCRLGVTTLTPTVSHICCTHADTPRTARTPLSEPLINIQNHFCFLTATVHLI